MTHNRTFSRGTKLPLLLACASFTFALGATSLTASDAHAFTPEYELGAFGGVHLWNPQSGLGRFDEATTNNALHHGPAFGIRLGLGLHALFMLEGELALLPTSVNNQFKDPDGNPNTDQVLAFGYRLHGLFHILTGRVRPFLLVGGGGVSTSSSNPNIIQQQTTGRLVPIQKLLRTPLTVLDVLTAPRLLRSVVTAIGVPRYVSGWELWST
jgi:hypothetical protein